MRKLNATHSVSCDVPTFWAVFLDPEYTRELILGELKFKALDVLEQTETTRRLRVVPKLKMPGPVMKVLGDSFGYEEKGRLDRERNTWHWEIIPNTLASKLTTSGSFRLEAAGDGACRRIDEATVEARIFGIGKLIESSTENEIKSAWDQECAFVERWLAKRG